MPNEENIVFIEMEPGRCHDNVEILYKKKKIKEQCEGYALSKDGVWRNHSFGIDDNGNIVETTEKRLCYVCVCEDRTSECKTF